MNGKFFKIRMSRLKSDRNEIARQEETYSELISELIGVVVFIQYQEADKQYNIVNYETSDNYMLDGDHIEYIFKNKALDESRVY